jgi:hypothetical protein
MIVINGVPIEAVKAADPGVDAEIWTDAIRLVVRRRREHAVTQI